MTDILWAWCVPCLFSLSTTFLFNFDLQFSSEFLSPDFAVLDFSLPLAYFSHSKSLQRSTLSIVLVVLVLA